MRKNLYLYLALACFLALIAVFVVDGYMGVYDTAYVTSGEQEQKIEADFWLQDYNTWSVGANWGEKVFFRYEIDNRQFSSYSADIEVSLWRSQQKIQDLLSQELQIASFDSGQLEWVVDTSELEPAPPEQGYEYTVVIKRGELERRIILYISTPSDFNKMPIPVPIK
jgi:hypothetical protein